MPQKITEIKDFLLSDSFHFAAITGTCRPRCSPIRTKDQCDMERCIFLARATSVSPYMKGTAYPLIDIPEKDVSINDRSSSIFTAVDKTR